MRVVLAAAGSRGDVAPFRALALRLRERGHEVAVVTHASLTPLLPPDVGVIPAASDPDELLSGPAARAVSRLDPRALNRTRHLFADFVQSFTAPTREALAGADVLVASTFAFAAVDEAMTAGVPVVRAHQWPELAGLDGPMPLVPFTWRLPATARRGLRAGLRSLETYFGGVEGTWEGGRLTLQAHLPVGLTTATHGTLLAFSPLVDPAVVRLTGADDASEPGPCVTGWWRESASASVSPQVQALVTSGEPLVYVGFGSMPQREAQKAAAAVRVACEVLGVRALTTLAGVTAGAGDPLVPIGDEPHDLLFPPPAGGLGWMARGAAAGLPRKQRAIKGEVPRVRAAGSGVGKLRSCLR